MKATTKSKVGMRFTTEDEPVYANNYVLYKNQSDVLSPKGGLGPLSRIFDRKGCMLALHNLVGEAKTGMVKNTDNQNVLATIPSIEQDLNELQQIFIEYQNDLRNSGYPVPDKMPDHMYQNQMKLYAKLDVCLLEKEKLLERLAEFDSKVEAVENEQMLKYGPLGSGRLEAGILVEIDGQRVEKVQGELVITSKSSPYSGMRVPDYRQFIMAPFQEQRRKRLNELHEKRKAELLAKGTSSTVVNTSLKAISRQSLPPWPEGIRNYLEYELK